MTAPALAHDTPFGRMYSRSLAESPSVPSITTIIGLESPDLAGWHGYMAAQAVAKDARLAYSLGDNSQIRRIVKEAADASTRYRDDAAARGDRVHFYCEQLGRSQLGQPHQVEQALEALKENGEEKFAVQVDRWWKEFGVQPLETELTVWNAEVGYAGTLDLVATIAGHTCLIDFKTKGTGRDGRVKAVDPKVIMQLVAGFRAHEQLVDPQEGAWKPFEYQGADMLLAVAIGEGEVATVQARPEILPLNWRKFWALRQAWGVTRELSEYSPQLMPLGPPAHH